MHEFVTLRTQNPHTMSYVLAAIDFSATSANAAQYAAGLAVQHDMQLVLFHTFIFPAMVNDVNVPSSLLDETRADAEKNMTLIAARLKLEQAAIRIKTVVTYSTFTDAVTEYANGNGKPWLLVMGNSNTQENSSWFFSMLKTVRKDLEFAVLAVPLAASFKHVERICYADDIAQKENLQMLDNLRDIALRSKAVLHVLNVQEDTSPHDAAYDVGDLTHTMLADANPQYHYRHQANVDESIREFCATEQIDWLVVTPGKYSFLEGLFHKSHTKVLAEMLQIPLLILH